MSTLQNPQNYLYPLIKIADCIKQFFNGLVGIIKHQIVIN